MGAATALYSATCFAMGRYSNGIPYPLNIRAVVGLSGWLPGSRYDSIRIIWRPDPLLGFPAPSYAGKPGWGSYGPYLSCPNRTVLVVLSTLLGGKAQQKIRVRLYVNKSILVNSSG